jgi:epoxyqueuosine reductase
MKKSDLERALERFSQESPLNYVEESVAIAPQAVGLRMYDAPIVGYGAADDSWFDRLQKEEAVGPHFQKPTFWLPGAKTVISFFAPKSEEVRRDNAQIMNEPSIYWLHARKEGQEFINGLCRRIMELLVEEGYQAVAPSLDSRFRTGAIRINQEGQE